jgi:hypothetical protein
MCRQIGERDGTDAFGHNSARRSIALERIVEPQGLVRDEFSENVGGKDLCERAEPQQRILGGKLMGVGRGFAVSVEEHLIVANDDENHTGGAGLNEEVCAESVNGLDVGKRCWLSLRESRHEGQQEQEDKQSAREFSVAHSSLLFLGYRTEQFLKTEMIQISCELLTSDCRRPITVRQESWHGRMLSRELTMVLDRSRHRLCSWQSAMTVATD